jgi:plastocyanin
MNWRAVAHHGGRAASALALVVVASGLAACGGGGGLADVEPAPKVTVSVKADAFVPSHLEIVSGTRVTFVISDQRINTAQSFGTGARLTAVDRLQRKGLFDTHLMQPGEAKSVVFYKPRRQRFFSSLGYGMRGTIVVRPADPEH